MNNLAKHVQPQSWAEATQLANDISKSDLVPTAYRGKPSQILCAIQYGAEIGFSPFQALQSIILINGKASLSGDAMLALVSSHPDCQGVHEKIEGEGENRVAVCEIKRKGWEPTVVTFSVKDAQKASLWNKRGPWTDYPERMLAMRARGFACRNAFQDAIKGFISAEEAGDYPTKDKPNKSDNQKEEADEQKTELAPAAKAEATNVVPNNDVGIKEPAPPAAIHKGDTLNGAKKKAILGFVESNDVPLEIFKAALAEFGCEGLDDLPQDKATDLILKIQELKSEVTHG